MNFRKGDIFGSNGPHFEGIGVSKDVPFVRIIFCDAEATDAGYMAPEEIARAIFFLPKTIQK